MPLTERRYKNAKAAKNKAATSDMITQAVMVEVFGEGSAVHILREPRHYGDKGSFDRIRAPRASKVT